METNNTTPQIPYRYNFELDLPNSSAVLVLGILSIISCICYGVFGIVLSIIALVLASKDNNLYLSDPKQYSINSYNNLKAGKVCAIIGLSLSAVFVLIIIGLILLGLAEELNWTMY